MIFTDSFDFIQDSSPVPEAKRGIKRKDDERVSPRKIVKYNIEREIAEPESTELGVVEFQPVEFQPVEFQPVESEENVSSVAHLPKKRGRKRKTPLVVKPEYTWKIDYNNSDLPTIRYPTGNAVPDHLVPEFINLFPPMEEKKKSRKHTLQPSRKIMGREKEYLNWMKKFWTVATLSILVDIITAPADSLGITLSLIDWLCIGYSKAIQVTYKTTDCEEFNLHHSYSQNLDSYYRAYFDVFCRGYRILIEYEDPECPIPIKNPDSGEIEWDKRGQVGVRMVQGKKMVYLITSDGQLNFFRWAIQHKVIDYCEQNIYKLRDHIKKRKDQPPPESGKRRKLTENPKRSWYVREVTFVLDYEFLDTPCSNDPEPETEELYPSEQIEITQQGTSQEGTSQKEEKPYVTEEPEWVDSKVGDIIA